MLQWVHRNTNNVESENSKLFLQTLLQQNNSNNKIIMKPANKQSKQITKLTKKKTTHTKLFSVNIKCICILLKLNNNANVNKLDETASHDKF